ncbi:MAG: hypothetical protein NVSMB31_02360 [Vulcanimicrobiaceae bacterium]
MFAAFALLAACGQGTSSAPTVLLPGTTAIAVLPAGTTVTLSQNGFGASTQLPATTSLPAPTQVTAIWSTSLPAGLPVLQSQLRHPQSLTRTALFFIGLQFSADVSFSGAPGFTLALPSSVDPKAGPFFFAFYDPTNSTAGWQFAVAGTPVLSGTTLTAAPTSTKINYVSGVTYWFALYQQINTSTPAPGPTPTPSPTSTPSPTPTATPTAPPPGVLSVNPSVVNIYGLGPSFSQGLQVQETAYTGPFSQTNTCNPAGGAIATFSPATGTGPTMSVNVTGARAGTCSITYSDSSNQQTSVTVTVTTNGIVIQSHGKGF